MHWKWWWVGARGGWGGWWCWWRSQAFELHYQLCLNFSFPQNICCFGRRGKMCGWSCCCAHVQSWFAWLPVGLSASLQLRRKENPPQCHPTTALLRCVAFIHLPCPPKEGEKMVGQEKITRKLWCENMPFQWAIDGALTMELMLQKFAKHTHIHTHRHTHKFPLAWDTSGTQHLLSDVSRCIEPPFGLGVK